MLLSPEKVLSPNAQVDATINGSGWIAYLRPQAAGGDFTLTAECIGCTNQSASVLSNVTFGDVWYCSGQSNMWLPMEYSFSRNLSVANISMGNLDNVRLMAGNSQAATFHPWMTAKQSIIPVNGTAHGQHDKLVKPLFSFSAACWYFGESLTRLMRDDKDSEVIPLGLMCTAIGGTQIEAWTPNATNAQCANHSQTGGGLWEKKVVPYLSVSVKGWLWCK